MPRLTLAALHEEGRGTDYSLVLQKQNLRDRAGPLHSPAAMLKRPGKQVPY